MSHSVYLGVITLQSHAEFLTCTKLLAHGTCFYTLGPNCFALKTLFLFKFFCNRTKGGGSMYSDPVLNLRNPFQLVHKVIVLSSIKA